MSVIELAEQIRALLWQLEVATCFLVASFVATVLSYECELSVRERATNARDGAGDPSSTPSSDDGDE